MDKNKIFQVLILILLISWYGFFLFHKVDLTTADLGRHIKNGELVLSGESNILKTNFYSYAEPNFPFINHHWGGGVIFYFIWKISGFAGLSLLYLFLSLLTFCIFFRIAWRESNFYTPFFLSLFLIPLIAQRTEIRPEIFSYFLISLFFWILWKWRKKEISWKWLLILPCLQVFWVNIHIYFIFGPALIGLFLVERLIKKKKVFNKFGAILVLSGIVCLINPFFIKGFLSPFNIFQNYGYRIVENQSVFFLQRLGIINNPNLILYEIVFAILCLTFVLIFFLRRKKISFIYFCLAVVWSVLGWWAIRNFTLFGLFVLPILSYNFYNSLGRRIKLRSFNSKIFFAFISLVLLLILFANYDQKLPLNKNLIGLGLVKENNYSAQFFKENNIKGPIFNNYDIGGYLIYHLHPQEKVFTDNRPEAYSVDFFEKIYIPAQQNNSIWQKQMDKYNFNSIFFSHRDYTPWGQSFLIERVNDPQWAVVFVDSFSIIFLKRNSLNQELIKKYEIPKENFIIVKK